MRSDCVHRVPSGAVAVEHPVSGRLHLQDAQGNFLRVIPRCEQQDSRPLFERDLIQRQKQQQKQGVKLLTENVATDAAASASATKASRRRAGGRHLLQFPADYDGWEAYTEWKNDAGIDVFLGFVRCSCPVAAAAALLLL